MLRTYLLSLAAVAATALSVVSIAAADPPTRTFSPSGPFSGSFCPGFDVLVTPVVNREYSIAFSNGAIITTGRFVAQLTNLSSGTSIVVNVSGPGFLSDDGVSFTLRGATLVLDTGGFLYPGSPPATQLLSGQLAFDGLTGNVSETGRIRDLCVALAG
jgi:hypothetical protein